MEFTREEHIQFLDLELKEQTQQYIATIQTSAISLLAKDEVYSTQFVKFENGELILKFKNDRGIPRKGEFLTAVLLKDNIRSYKNWGNITWAELRTKHQIEFSETVCIWQSFSGDKKFSIAGFRGVSLDFAEKLVDKCIVILGPKEPPYQYIQNLIKIVNKTPINSEPAKILDFDVINNNWEPIKLDNQSKINNLLLNQISLSKEIIIQGPPGTGKTYLMSEITAKLLSQNKSVLVTALTNRALIELVSKPALKPFLEQKKVHKTNLTVDEEKEVPKLQNTKEIVCSPENLSLATFYISSSLGAEIPEIPPFDYVIMDEASQALLAMFTATKLLGKHIIWIGDPYQLPPVVSLKDEIIKKKNLNFLIKGMNTICENISVPSYQLVKSYRLTDRSVKYTGVFYNDSLVSSSSKDYKLSYNDLIFDVAKLLNPKGGPTLIKTSLPIGDAKPDFGIYLILSLVRNLYTLKDGKIEISILTKLRRTVKEIQKGIANNIGNQSNLLVDTIERVQGLTNDITIFFIPNTMLEFSLNRALFNVATSRAKGQTLIIIDKGTLNYPHMNREVKEYLKKLDKDFSFEIEPSYNYKKIGNANA